MKRSIVILLTASFACGLLVQAVATPAARAVQPCPVEVASARVDAKFIATSCVGCHELDKVCRALGKKDAGAWLRTVKRMAEARGADITPFGAAEVADYLASPDNALGQVCGK